MSLSQIMTESLRCSLLRALNEAPSYTLNDSLLHDIVQEFAMFVSRDQVKTQLYWLRDQGFIEIVREVAGVLIVQITTAGIDVACGNRIVPGVKRPTPK